MLGSKELPPNKMKGEVDDQEAGALGALADLAGYVSFSFCLACSTSCTSTHGQAALHEVEQPLQFRPAGHTIPESIYRPFAQPQFKLGL